MNARKTLSPFAAFVGLVCAVSATLFITGCDGCARKSSVQAPAQSATSAVPASQPVDAVDSAPDPDARKSALAQVGRYVPSGVTFVAAFDPARLLASLHKVARNAPKLVRAEDHQDIRARLLKLYGIDILNLKGPCLLAGLSSGEGRLLVCSGTSEIVVPEAAEKWSSGPYSGPIVNRRGSRISIGNIDGRLIAGDEAAVYTAISAYMNRAPSLGLLFARSQGLVPDLLAEDAWRDIAIVFPGAWSPAWCPDRESCQGSAIFGGPDGFAVVSLAPDAAGTDRVKAAMESAWRLTVAVPFEKARAEAAVVPEYFKDAETSIQDNSIRVRDNRVILQARGDLLDLLAVIRMSDLGWFLGE